MENWASLRGGSCLSLCWGLADEWLSEQPNQRERARTRFAFFPFLILFFFFSMTIHPQTSLPLWHEPIRRVENYAKMTKWTQALEYLKGEWASGKRDKIGNDDDELYGDELHHEGYESLAGEGEKIVPRESREGKQREKTIKLPNSKCVSVLVCWALFLSFVLSFSMIAGSRHRRAGKLLPEKNLAILCRTGRTWRESSKQTPLAYMNTMVSEREVVVVVAQVLTFPLLSHSFILPPLTYVHLPHPWGILVYRSARNWRLSFFFSFFPSIFFLFAIPCVRLQDVSRTNTQLFPFRRLHLLSFQ